MLNTVYRLVAPRRFEVAFSDIELFKENQVIVRPQFLSICHADQRYYQGLRPADILAKKLPMALIHESIGVVVQSCADNVKVGDRVVMIPNTPVETDEYIAENYLRSSKFRASGFDGFMQDLVALDADRVVKLPEGIDNHVASFIELMSVSVHAILRFKSIALGRRDNIAIFGDGNLGFITGIFLKSMLPGSKLSIFGVNEDKLASFSFADNTYNVAGEIKGVSFDHAFECVGNAASGQAIENIIDFINPEGSISLLGVSEYPVPINTRMVLEKGLRLFGSSRSGLTDFNMTVDMLKENPWMVNYLSNIINNIVPVKDIADMNRAFELDIQKPGGKTIMEWNK
ncbi:GroES-like protein [Catonella morbi ATCC 51271]|uniref:GroES-like protein n=1 Tax=Catonella morbi ATCC 51271 TaxID=592026 RepID=V2YAK8_9FIRM|nr:ribitol-5-phosphate dehydrogenase [Catonella morbi]ESL04686.1 GroES-like protein [Catonella morbi ATCC 51271]